MTPLALLVDAPGTGPKRTEEETQALALKATLLLGVLCVAVAGGAYLYAQKIPDGSAPAKTLDLATLGEAEPTSGNAYLEGDILTELTFQIVEEADHGTTTRHIAPVVPSGSGASAPLRFFQEFKTRGGMKLAGPIIRHPGYMAAEALPSVARDAYVEAGFEVAEQTWIVKPLGRDGRTLPYTVAGVAGMFGFFTLLAGVLVWMRQRKEARQSRKL